MALVVAAEVVVEGTGGGGLGSVFVAGGTLVAETGTTGAAGESVFASDVAVGSSWSFFLRLKKPRRPFFTWENASSGTPPMVL